MSETIQQRLREALPEVPAEDLSAVVAFAEFLVERRRRRNGKAGPALSDEEHARRMAAFSAVVALSAAEGPPVSNRDHDRALYGAG